MTTLDDIDPGQPTIMTAGINRLFASAGCSPTVCHACRKTIKVGDVFKLVPHKKTYPSVAGLTDEMCCSKCGDLELVRRDAREGILPPDHNFGSRRARAWNSFGGYSRPSKQAKE